MEDPGKILMRKKLDDMGRPAHVEHFVEGKAVGQEGTEMVPCIIEGKNGYEVSVKLADGPDTGCTFNVDEKFVKSFGEDFYDDAAQKLF